MRGCEACSGWVSEVCFADLGSSEIRLATIWKVFSFYTGTVRITFIIDIIVSLIRSYLTRLTTVSEYLIVLVIIAHCTIHISFGKNQ